MNTETIPDPVQAIHAALLLGPTPGPWTTISRATYHWEEEADVLDAHGNDIESAEFVKPIGDVPTTRGQMYMRDAQFIAAANPQALTVLLDRLEAAERDNDRLRAQTPASHEVFIDFDQIGTAGPFPVIDGRVCLPNVTMLDLAQMLEPTRVALAGQHGDAS